MKTYLNPVLLFSAVLSASALVPFSAAANRDFPVTYPVSTVTASDDGSERIICGMSRRDVQWAMRFKAGRALSPDVWVYSGFEADLARPNQQGCGTLVITFARDQVVDLQLVNKSAVTAIAATLKFGKPGRSVASTR